MSKLNQLVSSYLLSSLFVFSFPTSLLSEKYDDLLTQTTFEAVKNGTESTKSKKKNDEERPNAWKRERFYDLFTSEKKAFVWVCVYKVASLSIKNVLYPQVDDLIQERLTSIPEKAENYFTFAFVRNPWDRIVSCYHHKIVNKAAPHFKDCYDKDFGFFVEYIGKLDVKKENLHIRPQASVIPVDQCDFIGKLENFSEDFKYVCQTIGVELVELPYAHKVEHAHYSTYYTPRTRKIIERLYNEDIEIFGYSFESQ